ncbi:MAG: hypothetical protein WHT06_05310 [Desulfobacterales bacterium]
MIVRGTEAIRARLAELVPGDVAAGPLPASFLSGPLAVDLAERGVRFVPSLLCQMLTRSKCAQVEILSSFMAPHTRAVRRRAELLQAVDDYARLGIGAVVSKQEGLHCGHGVRRWESAEALYNTVAFEEKGFPFVLQPFIEGLADVRVIVVGDYVEAYLRENPFHFRANLAAGGTGRPFPMDPAAERFCRAVMARGRFPYAHLDLQLTPEGKCYLAEIALEAGAAAARIGRAELARRKREVLEQEIEAAAEGIAAKETETQGEGKRG